MHTFQKVIPYTSLMAVLVFASMPLTALAKSEAKGAIGPSTIDWAVQDTHWGQKRLLESPQTRRLDSVDKALWPQRKAMKRAAIVEALIDVKGVPKDVHLKESCGDKDWDDVVLRTMKKWRFFPLIEAGNPSEYVARQAIYLGRL